MLNPRQFLRRERGTLRYQESRGIIRLSGTAFGSLHRFDSGEKCTKSCVLTIGTVCGSQCNCSESLYSYGSEYSKPHMQGIL